MSKCQSLQQLTKVHATALSNRYFVTARDKINGDSEKVDFVILFGKMCLFTLRGMDLLLITQLQSSGFFLNKPNLMHTMFIEQPSKYQNRRLHVSDFGQNAKVYSNEPKRMSLPYLIDTFVTAEEKNIIDSEKVDFVVILFGKCVLFTKK